MNAFNARRGKPNIKSMVFIAITALFCIAACALMFCANISHAVALEQEIRCGISEHTHSDACYDGDFLTCKRVAHTHDGNCYIVLLKENNINTILSLLGAGHNRSLEYVIADVMNTALTFNEDLNAPEEESNEPSSPTPSLVPTLTQDTVAKLNSTISDEDTIPDVVLNENINNKNALKPETDTDNDANIQSPDSSISMMSVGDSAVSTKSRANIFVYLNRAWTCIGNCPTTSTGSGNNRSTVIATTDLLAVVNNSLGTNLTYQDFDLAASRYQNYSYNVYDLGQTQATVGTGQSSSNATATRYVRLVPKDTNYASNTAFAFSSVHFNYPDGSQSTVYVRNGQTVTLPSGNYIWNTGNYSYNAGDRVTISAETTFTGERTGPIEYVSINYDVAFPTVSDVTVSVKPTLAGLTMQTTTDGFSKGAAATIRNVSKQSVEGKVNNNSTGLSRVIQFKGWQLEDSDVILQPNTTLVWEELLQYADGASLNLTAIWEYDALQTATFFIRFDSVAVDTNGNITGQDQNKYTNELFSAYIGGVDPSLGTSTLHNRYHIADTTSDNSFGADQKIRALYGERTDGVWLSAFPADDYIFESLVQYAKTGYLSVGGVPVKAEDLNSREYAIRWYVFKAQDDAWHIDGKLVKKEGLIHVYKTFAGNKQLITKAKDDFHINALDVTTGVNTVLDLTNYTKYTEATDTYMWEIADVDYGEEWEITEIPHKFTDPTVNFSVFSEFTVMDAHGDQSITGTGTSMTVRGMTYALDEGKDEVLRAEFTNIYNRSDSIIIKKQDSRTGMSIGGAIFRLMQNGQALKFHYDTATNRYLYDPTGGTITDLSGTANGYFEIAIEDFSYDLGPITIREIKPPTGYTPIGDIEIGHVDDDDNVGILSGNSELIRFAGGVLIVGNSTDASSVTAKKEWDCPENEWQPVTVQLLANGKLVTTIIAGVDAQMVLSADNNWQHTWDNLPVYVNGEKIDWSIKETAIGTEAAKADGSFVNWLVSYELPVKTTDADGKENTLLTVTNTTKRVMLRLTKTDIGKTTQLADATFRLEGVDANGNVLATEITKTATTGKAGTLVFDNLKCGVRYRITETAPPSGYLPLEEPIYLTIHEGGSVTVEETYFAEAGSTAYNVLVFNAPMIVLPDSGGAGTTMYYALGILLLAVAVGIYIDTLRKRRCHR